MASVLAMKLIATILRNLWHGQTYKDIYLMVAVV